MPATTSLSAIAGAAGVNVTKYAANYTAVTESSAAQPLLWTNFALFLWQINMIQGIGMMTIAGVIGQWYFTRPEEGTDKKHIPMGSICSSLHRVFRYHLGTIAFGSLLITIVQLIRAILMYVDEHTKGAQQNNTAMKIFMKVVQCCLWCFEKCLKFITNNAYIITATRGTAFCTSTYRAFTLIMGQVVTLSMLNMITAFVMVVGKLFVTGISVVAAYIWITQLKSSTSTIEIRNKTIPLAMTGLLAYTVARTFLQVLHYHV